LYLNVTSSALKETLSELQDIIKTVQDIKDGWDSIGSTLKDAQTAFDDSSH